jgi:hypothetical protein
MSLVLAVRCAFRGHEIKPEDVQRLSTVPIGDTIDTQCKVCGTPLRIRKLDDKRYSIKESYWAKNDQA